MADDQENDFSAIAWPGFVDILSAVIIMFVFFLMVVATALYFHIIIYISKTESNIAVEQVESESEFEFSQIQTEFAETLDQEIISDAEKKEFIVFFGEATISVVPAIREQIISELRSYAADGGDYEVVLTASKSNKSIDNIARQIAVARMLNVRNGVVDAQLEDVVIIPRVQDGYEIDGNLHWVKVELREK